VVVIYIFNFTKNQLIDDKLIIFHLCFPVSIRGGNWLPYLGKTEGHKRLAVAARYRIVRIVDVLASARLQRERPAGPPPGRPVFRPADRRLH
jgi:hypothetical protein